MARRAELQK